MIAQICLTPWESKRLIAKGVVQLELIKKALTHGIISIGRGTTNGYVVEELLGTPFEKERYVAGGIGSGRLCLADMSIAKPEIAFIKGELHEISTAKIIQEMGAGDVFIKGGNALDPNMGVGILLGSETAGTIGGVIGAIYAKGIELVLPVGLEKMIPTPVETAAMEAGKTKIAYATGMPAGLFPVYGTTITEMHALELLANVEAIPIAAGGIAGGEGSVVLQISGNNRDVQKTIEVIKNIKGEPPLKVAMEICKSCQWTCAWQGKDQAY
ncbi:MAG: hypothetical protein ACE5R6_05695 [Candidatus Heimdallarchaeota archaeon]